MIDWTLIPQSMAKRPDHSILLFEKVEIPIAAPLEPEALDQNQKAVEENWAFFWMMAAITLKYIQRGDGVFATRWIENLHGIVREIERRLNREPWQYTRGSFSTLQLGREEQLKSIRDLCNRMLDIKERVSEFTSSNPHTPIAEIEELLNLSPIQNRKSKIVNLKS